ncbi:MAG: D-amino-acid transaminase [Pseudomonadota bacterium]
MSRTAYVDGRYRDIREPSINIEDRGYQFSDGVYEVIKVVNHRLCDVDRHLDRLFRSLAAIDIAAPMSRSAITTVLQETYRRNRLSNAILYVQVTRGVGPRNHVARKGLRSILVVTCRRALFPTALEREGGVAVITLPDQRWGRCDIKSISLLANVLAKQAAADESCREAWLYDHQGMITEGSSSNAYIVNSNNTLVTHPLGPAILGGVTRSRVLEIAAEAGIAVEERPFSIDEALAAREAFLTSTTSLVLPVTSINGQTVANGHPGSMTSKLAALYEAKQGLMMTVGKTTYY